MILHRWMVNQHVKMLVASFKVPHHHFIVRTEKTNENLHQDSWSPGQDSNLRIYRTWKNSMPKLPEVKVRTKTKIHCPATMCWTCVLAVPITIKEGLRFEIKQNQWRILKKVLFLPILSRWSNVWSLTTMQHRLCALKCQGCCCLDDKGKILFSIKWQWVNHVFREAFLPRFSTAIFREKQILILHLSTATKKKLHSIFWWTNW